MDIREYGYKPGCGKTGAHNRITDVPGVRVGHCTVDEGAVHTGVTVILPCEGSAYERKPVAAVHVINGYGKTSGTIQVQELGCLESPIALTNTLNVGRVQDALVGYVLQTEAARGREVRSVNCLVGETNDSEISDIAQRAVGAEQVLAAIRAAETDGPDFAEGDVGAGRGTICCDLKGGIGSASRVIRFGGQSYTIGALVQSNFGSLKNLMICGEPVGREIERTLRRRAAEAKRGAAGEASFSTPDVGSIMMVIGTDLPLSARQLGRVIRRAEVGLVRTGSFLGTGSGDVVIGFSNGNYLGEEPDGMGSESGHAGSFRTIRLFPEERINEVFTPAAEAVEEAIYNSLCYAHPAVKRDGTAVYALPEFLADRGGVMEMMK